MIRLSVALVLAVAAALAVDHLARQRGLDPPGFRQPHRRALATLLLGLVFLFGVFGPAVNFDRPPEIDFESLSSASIFLLQTILLLVLGLWYGLGYVGVEASPEALATGSSPDAARPAVTPAPSRWVRLFGLACRDPLAEVGIGLVGGLFAWIAVLAAAAAVAVVVAALGGEEILAAEPPEMIVWMAALPVAVRLLVSLVAGVVEELFFRGFLQRRAGIALSTFLFVCGHLGYGHPFMLVGLTLLSLFYAFLVAWRGNVWAAMAAHFLFDAVQLVVIIPAALELRESGLDSELLAAFAIC